MCNYVLMDASISKRFVRSDKRMIGIKGAVVLVTYLISVQFFSTVCWVIERRSSLIPNSYVSPV